MLRSVRNKCNDNENDLEHIENQVAFDSVAKCTIIINNHHIIFVKMKEKVMSFFKHSKSTHNKDKALYSYTITIQKTKSQLFNLTIPYVAYKVLFGMMANIIGKMYNVFFAPSLHFCTCDNMNIFVMVTYIVNF